MSNTPAKINCYLALGYSLLAEQTPKEELQPSVSKEKASEHPIYKEENDILPINNQILNNMNIQINASNLKI